MCDQINLIWTCDHVRIAPIIVLQLFLRICINLLKLNRPTINIYIRHHVKL